MADDDNLKPILGLKEMSFFVDSYQRGYKWDEQQVKELLNDIDTFVQEGENFYCLQPIVVKKKGDEWELIDGQQRLTTINIILSYMSQHTQISEVCRQTISNLFTIKYYRKDGSRSEDYKYISSNFSVSSDENCNQWESFLGKGENKDRNLDNTDNYHFYEAYRTVKKWFECNKEFDTHRFCNKLMNHTKVIWYEVEETLESQAIFARMNSGKIPLTNAELIKSLFLGQGKKNCNTTNEIYRLKQREIAQQWDSIEYALHDDDFWFFLNSSKSDKPTRIEFIFDLIAESGWGKNDKKDPLFSFHHYAEKNDESALEKKWEQVREYFHTFEQWFNDNELYHYIGYLICIESTTVNDLKKLSEGKSKTDFKTELKNKIKKKNEIKEDLQQTIDNLSYGKNDEHIKRLLLLFNVITSQNSNLRFNFKNYKKEKWTLEHIHAQNSQGLTDDKARIEWLEQAKKYIKMLSKGKTGWSDGGIYKEIDKYIQSEENNEKVTNEFKKLYDRTTEFFSDIGSENEIHSISNLALLDGRTNSSINNSLFPAKRQMIIEKETKGAFIPICTKYVFLKYYSEDVDHIYFWSNKDRDSYIGAIKGTLKDYLPVERERS